MSRFIKVRLHALKRGEKRWEFLLQISCLWLLRTFSLRRKDRMSFRSYQTSKFLNLNVPTAINNRE
jgi:hypothetical protein